MCDENGTYGKRLVVQDIDVATITAPYFLIFQGILVKWNNDIYFFSLLEKGKQKSLLI